VRWLEDWQRRHQSALSFWLHMVGIPLTILALPLAIYQVWIDAWGLWWRPVALVAGGYLLQWIGHLWEGNDMGEVIVVKRWLGLPYTAISPRFDRGGVEAAQRT